MILNRISLIRLFVFRRSIWNLYLVNFLIGIVFWIIYFPGFYSSDSFSAVKIAETGNFSNWGGLSWSVFVYYFSLRGTFIPFLILINLTILIYSITFFSIQFLGTKLGSVTATGFTLSPLVFGFGNTLWHDVPFTAGMLLLSGALVGSLKLGGLKSKNLNYHLIASGILITFRTNGIPTLVLLFFITTLIHRFRNFLIRSILLVLTSSVVLTLSLALLLQQSPISNVASQEWMRADISCYSATEAGIFFINEQLKPLNQSTKWRSKLSCSGISQVKLTPDEYSQSTSIVPRAWLSLLIHEPWFILETHLERNSYLLPLPIFGVKRIPFLHSTIEIEHARIYWRFPDLANFMRFPIRLVNLLSFILGWPGIWIAIMLGIYFRHKSDELKLLVVISFSLMIFLFIVGPIADGRYTIYVLFVGIISLIKHLDSKFPKSKQKLDYA